MHSCRMWIYFRSENEWIFLELNQDLLAAVPITPVEVATPTLSSHRIFPVAGVDLKQAYELIYRQWSCQARRDHPSDSSHY